jgi:uncharacterized protein
MDGSDSRSRLLTELERSLSRDPDVEFAVAFGSRITDEPNPSSDLDLAVKFTGDLSPHERFRKLCFLSGDLQREELPFVDVSDVETLSVDVAHDAVSGELVCGDERTFRRFTAEIEAAFEKRRDAVRRHQRDVIDRIAEGGLRG